jgi:hypothetical protein
LSFVPSVLQYGRFLHATIRNHEYPERRLEQSIDSGIGHFRANPLAFSTLSGSGIGGWKPAQRPILNVRKEPI